MTDLVALREYCLSKKAATEDTPFGEDTLVFRVCDKMFALTGINSIPPRVNLKCDPERAVALREQYDAVIPGYHMNKKHWNTVILDGTIPADEIRELVDHSYELIVKGLKKSQREELEKA